VVGNDKCATLAALNVVGGKVQPRITKTFHDFSPTSTAGIYFNGKCETTSVCPRDSTRLESQKALEICNEKQKRKIQKHQVQQRSAPPFSKSTS